MATVFISEFGNAGSASGNLPFAMLSPIREQTVAISSVSAATTAAFDPASVMIRVHTDTNCFVNVSSAPVATSSKMRMAANQTEYLGINSNGNLKLAAIST